MLEFKLSIEPISTNKLYGNIPGQARRFISADGKKFKATVSTAVRDHIVEMDLPQDISSLVGKPLHVFVEVGLDSWFLKNGKTLRRKDLDNTAKGLLDTIFSTLSEFEPDIDDSQIWEIHMIKKVSLQPMTRVIIQEYGTLQ